MDALQTLLNLNADLEKLPEEIAAQGWVIKPLPLVEPQLEVSMKSRLDGESYTLTILAPDYPIEAPSIKFIDPETKRPDDPKAWPQCAGVRPPGTADLCLPISREGFATHPEWRNSQHAWNQNGNPIWFVLSTIQDLLNNPEKYHGRIR